MIVQATRWVSQQGTHRRGLDRGAGSADLGSQREALGVPTGLAFMNGTPDWIQQFGYAFADQQAAVSDSVRRLRRQAQTNRSLQSSPQQVLG
jgi:hypothetical protein